jgi:hypothetical protein
MSTIINGMGRVGIRIAPPSGGGYTTRTAAFAAATGITDTTILNALNTFDTGLISNGLDTKMKAVYPFVGSTGLTHKYNFMDARDLDAAFRLSFSGGFTNSSTGILPNGINAFANTFLSPFTNLSLNSHSFGIYSRTNNTTVKVYGTFDSANFLQHNFSGNFISGASGSNILTYTASPSQKLMLASRTSSTLFTAYRDGTSIGTNTNVNTGQSILPFYLFARNSNGTADLFTSNELSFAFLGDGLNSTEVTALNTLVNNMQTTLGRAV